MYVSNRRSGGEEEKNEDLLAPQKELEIYDTGIETSNQINIITSYNPDIIEKEIVDYLTGQKIEPKVNEKKYKIKFDYEAPMENVKDAVFKVSICIRILKVDENDVCVEFTKLSGPQDKYRQIVDDLKTSKCMTNVVA